MDSDINPDTFSFSEEEIQPRKGQDSDYVYPDVPDEIELDPDQYLSIIADKAISRQTLEESWKKRLNFKFSDYPNKAFREIKINEMKRQLEKVIEAYILPCLKDAENKRSIVYLQRLGRNDLWQNFLYSMLFLWEPSDIENSPLMLYVQLLKHAGYEDRFDKNVALYKSKFQLALEIYHNKMHQILVDGFEIRPLHTEVLPPIPGLEKRVGEYFMKDEFGHYLCLQTLEKSVGDISLKREIALKYLRNSDGGTYSMDSIKNLLYRTKGKGRKSLK